MEALKTMVRPLLPRAFKRKLREAAARREAQVWDDLNLFRSFAGLKVRVKSRSDWTVYNEIFVERYYDRAIAQILNTAPADRTLQVLDLGANVGFFTMRFAQMVFESEHPQRPFFIHCVEGSPRVHADLAARVAAEPRLRQHVEVRHGLVGLPSGSAQMYESGFGAGNSTLPQHWSKPIQVSYIDVNQLVPAGEPIDLLKCDIEGSEQTFQDNYQALLRRTQAVVAELHHRHIDREKFNGGMRALGFAQHDVLWEGERQQASLDFYRR